MSIREYLRRLNDPSYQVWQHNGYIDRIIRVGIAPDDRLDLNDNESGGNLIGDWYRRKLLIYRHILGRTSFGEDRIVVIIGADHVHTLKQFFQDNFNFTVVEANEYL